MVRSPSEYYTSMSISGLPTFKFVYLFCQTDMFLFVIETPIGKFKHPFSKLVGTSTLALQLPVQSVFIRRPQSNIFVMDIGTDTVH
jgi:hypothetical protein